MNLPQKKTIEAFWKLLQGNPQRLLQIAALAREDKLSLELVLSQIQPDELEQSLTRLILASLPKTQRWIMAVLVAMGGRGLLPEQIAVIFTQSPSASATSSASNRGALLLFVF